LLKLVRLPAWLEILVSVVLLDYTLFMWHYLTHKVPVVWRLHQAHHVPVPNTGLRPEHFYRIRISPKKGWGLVER
jgi:sterol desaturase/sphingolipid hydroxylase (fatty acid hydroxylase superfamily)